MSFISKLSIVYTQANTHGEVAKIHPPDLDILLKYIFKLPLPATVQKICLAIYLLKR